MVYDKFALYYDLIYKKYDYIRECDFLESVFKMFKCRPKNILDVACGTGTHATMLAKRGYKIEGIDSSPLMIKKAIRKAQESNLDVNFLVQDMRELKLEKRFDCAICMFGGFGYLITDEDVKKFLSNLKLHLHKDGLFLFEFWHIGGLKPTPYRSWDHVEDKEYEIYRFSESNYNVDMNLLNIEMHFIVFDKAGKVDRFREAHLLRIYSVSEIRKLLETSGFYVKELIDGDIDKNKFEKPKKDAFRMFVITHLV